MKKSDLIPLLTQATGSPGDMAIRNVRVLPAKAEGGANPAPLFFYEPDLFKSYIEFDICHSFPQVTGPTMAGAYIGYHPEVLAANHHRLLHQWVNLRHQAQANDGRRDRIVGCVVATYFPDPPAGGWAIPARPEDAPFIRACAVVYKLAEGMDKVIGAHQTGRDIWSVSIEVDATMENMGIYQPSTRSVWTLMEAPDAMLGAVAIDPAGQKLTIGRVNGEQLALAYGARNGELHFRGVGMTPNPAERTARITSMRAEAHPGQPGQLFAMAAEGVDDLLDGRVCAWGHWSGTISEVKKEGKIIHPTQNWELAALPGDPALKIYLADGTLVMKRFSEIRLVA